MNEKLFEMNKDYLKILNSKQYKIGKLICELKESFKNYKSLKRMILLNYRRIKIRKYSRKNKRFVEIKNISHGKPKIAVYTAIFGCYDEILNPMYVDEKIDYFIFTDLEKTDDMIWSKVDIGNTLFGISEMTNVEKNRYFKMLGYNYFLEYDYVIYIDGNLQIYGDIVQFIKYANNYTGLAMYSHPERDCIYNEAKVCEILKKGNYKNIRKEINKYLNEQMPQHFGMCECNVIVKNMHEEFSSEILNEWWINFKNGYSKRDQLSFPYTLYKMGIKIDDLGCLGENMSLDPHFRRKEHTFKN